MKLEEFKELKRKEFYQKNWHRFFVAPILVIGIYFFTIVYALSGGFHIIVLLSFILSFIYSIAFVRNYHKKYFFILVFILLVQLLTANLNTRDYEVYCPDYWSHGKYLSDEFEYSKITCDCFGLTRQYYENKACIGKITNCILEESTIDHNGGKVATRESFPCKDYKTVYAQKREQYR